MAERARGPLALLERFLFVFRTKNGEWRHLHSGVSGYIWKSLTALIPKRALNLSTLCLSCHKQRFQL